uniref:Uncharacterized protein n=1 Tax=Cyprinus carpio carpio TaxID=630221 RepID=A0A9J8AKM1_CYPCA
MCFTCVGSQLSINSSSASSFSGPLQLSKLETKILIVDSSKTLRLFIFSEITYLTFVARSPCIQNDKVAI